MPQRTFKGTCALCGAGVDKRRAAVHYTICAPAHDVVSGRDDADLRACGAPATLVCCTHERDDSPFVCDAHEAHHKCGDEAFLPVVNSPRMGVCGYAG